MADVTPYRDQITPELGPNIGTDAMISAARRVGPLEREAGLMEQQGAAAIGQAAKDVFAQREAVQARREISAGLESHALIQGQQEADLNRLLSDPELSKDPNKLQAALKQIQSDTFDKENADWVSKNFTTQAGQDWATLHAAQQSAELIKHGFSMADIISSNEAITSAFNAANQYAANAIANPMTIDQQIASYRSGVQGIASTISDPVKRAEFEKAMRKSEGDIAYAGVHAAIENNPTVGRQLAKKYGDIMTPEHQTAAEGYAVATEKSNAFQARLDQAEQRRKETDQVGAASNNWLMTKLYGPDGVASDAMKSLLDISRMPGAAHEPGLIRAMAGELKTVQKEILSGKATQDNPAVFQDLNNRLALSPDDPRFPTEAEIGKARLAGDLSSTSAQEFRQVVAGAETNPGLTSAMADFKKFTDDQKPPSTTGYTSSNVGVEQSNNNFYTFYRDRREKFMNGLRTGLTPNDMLDPKSSHFIGFMTDQEKSSTAINPAQNAAPASQQQQAASGMADVAVMVTNLVRNNSIDDARNVLRQSGLDVPANMGSGEWGAPLVNTVLKAVNLPPVGDNFASSFKDWGAPIDARRVQKGDIFYAPSGGQAGIVVNSQLRAGPHGEPQVQVVSTGAGDGGRQALAEISQYARGNAAAGGPSPVSRIDPGFAGDISRMVQAMPPNIRSQFTIESGFRSPEREAQVYAEQHPGQAVPADSAHSHGLAVDIGKNGAVIDWITQHGSEYGVHFPLAGQPGEENHLEPISGGHGAPPTSGGVEWRDIGPMVFRRAKPPQADIKPDVASNPNWWQRNMPTMLGGVP